VLASLLGQRRGGRAVVSLKTSDPLAGLLLQFSDRAVHAVPFGAGGGSGRRTGAHESCPHTEQCSPRLAAHWSHGCSHLSSVLQIEHTTLSDQVERFLRFAFAQRVCTALRTDSQRCSAVIFCARALPCVLAPSQGRDRM